MTFVESLRKRNINAKDEILSGLTVALALVPEAVAFSIIAHVSPLTGLYTAFIIGLITAILGGRPAMISGATGSVAVVVLTLVVTHGPEYLFAAAVLMGLIQMLIGFLKLGKIHPACSSPCDIWFCKRTGHYHFYGTTRTIKNR